MKDFDAARKERETYDRSFAIGGETFTHRISASPEALIHWNQAITHEIELTEAAWVALYDETVLALLDPGQEEKWYEIRKPDREHPLTLQDMKDVLGYLIERCTGRPTTPPPDSSNGSGGTETTSKDASSSPAETALAL